MINYHVILILLFLPEIFTYMKIFEENNAEVIPILNEKNKKIYLVTGQTEENPNYSILIYSFLNYFNKNEKYFISEKKFENWEVILADNELEYFLVSNQKELSIYDLNNLKIISTTIQNEPIRGTLKKINSNYFYISSDYQINNMQINFNLNKSEELIVDINTQKFLENEQKISSVSCDICKNNECYICSYFLDENNYGISAFSNEAKLLYNKRFDISITNFKNYFNKIIYFKDNSKFISIHSISDDTIRLRYFEFNKKELNNKLIIKNIKDEYLDIKNTQYNPYSYNNDITILNNDTIIKVFADESKTILTKIQFYNSGTILTVKTFNFNIDGKSLFNYPRLATWRNKIVFTCSYKLNDEMYYSSSFFIFGYPSYNEEDSDTNLNINTNNNIKLNRFIISDNVIFSDIYIYSKIISIPKDFIFIDLVNGIEVQNNMYLNPEENELIFVQYKKNTPVTLTYEGIMFGEIKNETFEIFPSDAETPSETKYINEGDEIELKINIPSCNNGFYEVEYMPDICTNIRPNGYYLDKSRNIFKKCHDKCSECFTYSYDDLDMKCLKCYKGYSYDENTFNCISTTKNINRNDVSISLEKNMYTWFFVTIFFISLFSGIYFFVIYPCRHPRNKLTDRDIDYTIINSNINSIGVNSERPSSIKN